ncbi:8-amino-7-oxononanoate synthase [Aestuariibacter sp. A3R04]|uniref:8-amino-7-oxononanoate synthase n=1 Tax=Aestuariibacter sp. A3R04 TaxID=2841571 RepID=UPI001C093518|nr:8-amino-7-oxononanoate synthase [Aestuariibacter sp. A3R04]MBU3022478.1 8-amino-7-oxononanoate synthase [Aestuariibacter sp. A3R04]
MAFDFIHAGLQEKQEAGYLRERVCIEYEKDAIICINGEHYLNFASNDYLGMRQHHGVLQSWVEGLAQFGGGSGASPLVTGYTQAHCALESYLEEHLQREAVLLFNSGFAANQAICQALLKSDVQVFVDRYMHASFLDGVMAGKAKFKRYNHNDKQQLSSLLAASSGDKLVATEGIFSMDGDAAPVRDMAEMCRQHDAWLMLDDAHGFGVFGDNGLGTVEQYQLSQQDAPLVMGTFGKAVGTAGAFVAGSQSLVEYLINHARHYIYSTSIPASQAVATLFSLTAISTGNERERLKSNIAFFREQVQQHGFDILPSESAIQPLIIGDPNKAMAFSAQLRQRGIWVPAIRYPTVPKGSDRLRITLSAQHVEKDISVLVDALALARDSV